ncbi:enoyl-CoA hydratase/isomerase family protein [Actinoplanes teichomyceticus]|uniref:3-hydroxyisobutyryl-CoA hydrolase n=1 Tax=Actinoplanes teichomyceticus TaxID=1867 RepID=A0A561VL80_ACTTI|nr:enoyl-CoA hydratase/isomerase family protein [Actinoplanes teichomyceticus]TWG12347.1 enoyl-CoA hydratase [Actinoplanes teichomyceticus]GIF13705.1 putative enoyl-CoA hydratase [Actinoplanes teichomyceticus]
MSVVVTRVTGHLARITLNRPQAINALTAEMVAIMRRALAGWASDDRVRTVLITGAGERGLCAGGDIRAIHADAVSGGTAALDFFADEYRLNATIAAYPKPVVAFMDGLVMGGGIGVSAHASIRVVTERSRLAMPEVGIGMHPDVGGSWLLAHAPGELGTHLALTGTPVGAADAIAAGLADHHVASADLPRLAAALSERDAAEAVAAFAGAATPGEFATARAWIDDCYRGDSVRDIVARLAGHPEPGAQAAAKEIATRSPTALTVTLRSLRSAATLPDLGAALDQEYRLSAAMLRLPDLAEGIRAQIIDKDRRPRWRPATLAAVPGELVDACFAPLADAPDLRG